MSHSATSSSHIHYYSYLEEAIKDVKAQLDKLEPLVINQYYELLPMLEMLDTQTLDFLYYVQAQSRKSDDTVNPSSIRESGEGEQKRDKGKLGGLNHIVLRVSNNQYVPKVYSSQTVVTYKS